MCSLSTPGSPYAKREVNIQLFISMAGLAAEYLYESISAQDMILRLIASEDFKQADEWAIFLNPALTQDVVYAPEHYWQGYKTTILMETILRLTNPVVWRAVEALANALLEHRHIGNRKAREIIRTAMKGLTQATSTGAAAPGAEG
jgi:hypothetical protein